MSYKALYLTYRPKTFDEVAGQEAIIRTLKNSLATGKIAHAYLFAGPRGTGKTTMARLFAKALDCENGLGEQCNACSNCVDITEGAHPDVIEIDAASNNGVEQVRDLVEKSRYAPIRAHYKVYIIDEVHMMSSGAFNALLKTLEEPPEHVIFILATTEPQKVLPTIISRCQRFDFSRVEDADMQKKLIEVLKAEGASYEEEALKEVISLAEGGMRDALSILDQALSYSGNVLKEEDVLSIYGLISKSEKINLLKAVSEGDAGKTLSILDSYKDRGIDIRRLNSDLVNILKDLLVYLSSKQARLLDSLKEKQAQDLASSISLSKCVRFIDALIENANAFRNSSSLYSLFEISLLKLVSETSPFQEDPLPKLAPKAMEEVKAEPAKPAEPKPLAQKAKEEPTPEPEPLKASIFEMAENKVIEPIKKAEEPKPAKPKVEPKKGQSEPPDFLFEEEPEEPEPSLDTKGLSHTRVAMEGEKYEIPDEEIIKVLVLGEKDERRKASESWKALEPLRNDPKIGNLASLLFQGKPFCLCKEAIVLNYQFRNLKEKALLKENQKALSSLLERIIGREVFVIAIDHSDQNRIMSSYYGLQTIKKLPRKEEITLNLPK